jgi:DNA-binding NarL/FixJ family response regulator
VNKKIRIMIVDDNNSFRLGMQALLKIQPDMLVVGLALNGRKALEMLEKARADLVLLDAEMPGLNGIEVTQRVKGRWPGVKVILMTMYPDYRAKSIEAGADAFLTKGLPPEHVLSLIRELMTPKGMLA